MKKNIATVLSVFALGFLGTAEAALISPESIVSNDLTSAGWSENNLINQSGLITSFVDGETTLEEYSLLNTNAASPSYESNGGYFAFGAQGTIIFDLGQSYAVDDFLLWNDTDIQGINNFTISISDDMEFGSVSGSFDHNAIYGDIYGGSSYSSPVPMQVFDTGSTAGQYVKLSINSLHSSSSANFGEVAFNVSSISVPEPTSIALLGLGLFGLGFSRVKKKNNN